MLSPLPNCKVSIKSVPVLISSDPTITWTVKAYHFRVPCYDFLIEPCYDFLIEPCYDFLIEVLKKVGDLGSKQGLWSPEALKPRSSEP